MGATRCSLTDSEHWDVDGADFGRALGAFSEVAPAGSLLGLAEGVWSRDIRDFLEEYGVSLEAGVLSRLPREFGGAPFLPLEPRTIRQAVFLSEGHAETELAIHLIVVHGGVSLVEWYDLPGDPIAIRSSVDEALVAHFAATVGGHHRLAQAGE